MAHIDSPRAHGFSLALSNRSRRSRRPTVPAPIPVPIGAPDAQTLAEIDIAGDKHIQATATIGGSAPGDSSLVYYCHGREQAPHGDWFWFNSVILQWIRESDAVVIGNAYEVHGRFMQNSIPSPMSGSTFITIV